MDVKYECVACDERGFSSRVDWLFHLVLERHSLKAQENKQKLYLQSGGKWLVVSEIGHVENGLILEYVANRLPSISNFFTFRPHANLCIVVCSEGSDFEWFTQVPHIIDGIQPNFRDYNEIPRTAWNSYFIQNQTSSTQVKKEPASNYQEENRRACSSRTAYFPQDQVKKEPDFIHQEEIVSASTSDAGASRNSGNRNSVYDHDQNFNVNSASGSTLPTQEAEGDSGDAIASCNEGNSSFTWRNSIHSNWNDSAGHTTKRWKGSPKLKCRWCNKDYYTEKPLLLHIAQFHKDEEEEYTGCPKSFEKEN